MPEDKLTDAQVRTLADILIDTSTNIFHASKATFGIEATDEDFDRLAKLENKMGIFKCERCDQWISVNYRSDEDDICTNCSEGE